MVSRSYRDGPCGSITCRGHRVFIWTPSIAVGNGPDPLTHRTNNLSTHQLYASFEDNSTLFKTNLRSAPAADAQLHNVVHNGPSQTDHLVPHQDIDQDIVPHQAELT